LFIYAISFAAFAFHTCLLASGRYRLCRRSRRRSSSRTPGIVNPRWL